MTSTSTRAPFASSASSASSTASGATPRGKRATFLRRLSLGGAITGVAGVGFAIAAVALPDVLGALYRAVGPGTATDVGAAARLGAGIYGGLMAGWGLMLFLLGREVAVERAAGAGLLAWFVVDSAASIATGYPLNALSNAGFLALFAPAFFALRAARAAKAEA